MNAATALKLVAMCWLAIAGRAASASPHSAEMLLEDCRTYAIAPASSAATRCAFYVHGFLDAARAQEPSQAETVVRLPFGSRVARIPDGQQGQYCIGADASVEEIIHVLLRESEQAALQAGAPAGELLELMLRLLYPCSRSAFPRQ